MYILFMSFLFSILLIQPSYIYWSCIPVFFQLWWWLVRLMTFTSGMPWRKEGRFSGKGEPQRAHYSSLVCHHLAPMQCRVAQQTPYFTPGKPSGPSVPHLPGLPSPQEEAAASTVESPPVSCRLVGAQPPPGVLHRGKGKKGTTAWARMLSAGSGTV